MQKDTRNALALVIDSDPTARAAVGQASQRLGWGVIEAADSLTGIELFRRYESAISLVVLDPSLPELDGYDTCLRLRAISHNRNTPIPILPFTSSIEAETFLAGLGCAPILLKPAEVDEIEQALRRTSTHPAFPSLPLAFLNYAYRKAIATEQGVRQHRRNQPRVVLFVPAYSSRLGLAFILRSIGIQVIAETGSTHVVHTALSQTTNHILVSDAEGSAVASIIANEHGVPLLILAVSESQCHALMHDDALLHMADSVLDISTDGALCRLPEAFTAIQTGRRFICLNARGQKETQLELTVPPHVVAYFLSVQLSRRSIELLWLDYQGKSTSEVARQFIVTEATVQSHWKRLQRKTHQTRGELRAWFRQRLAAVQLQG